MPVRPPTYRPPGRRNRRQANAEYDTRRGSSRERGYDAQWDREALAYRSAHPLCLGCQAVGRVAAAALVDHIVPHKGDPALMWNPDNRQPSCTPHHDIVKQRLEVLFSQGKVSADDLRLDSAKAIELTLDLLE
jgi:5-methylcytosine-specific restriction enzyme A